MNYTLSESDRNLFQQVLNGLRRGGFNFTPMGMSLPQQGGASNAVASVPLVWRVLKITGYTTPSTLGDGKYWANVFRRTVTAIDATPANFDPASALESTETVVVINLADDGQRLLDDDDYVTAFSLGELTATGPYPIYYTSGGGGGIWDIRYNTIIHALQATYRREPAEADWISKVSFSPCTNTPALTRVGAGGFTGASRELREIVSVSAGEGPNLVTTRRRFTGKASGRYEV